MAGTPNPIDSAIVDGSNVSKATFRSYEKTYVRKVVSDWNAIANGDWSGQFAGLHLISDNSDWDIDTSDTTTASDHVNFQRDANGILFKRVQPTVVVTSKLITTTGNVTIADDETADEIEINNTGAGAINVYLPSAAVRTKSITITDVAGNAATKPITVLPKLASGQTIMTGTSWVIDSNGGGIKLTPNSARTGFK